MRQKHGTIVLLVQRLDGHLCMINTSTVDVWINGESRPVPFPLSLQELLHFLTLEPRLVAVEFNGEILHRQHWTNTPVVSGDRLEIVTIVGGG